MNKEASLEDKINEIVEVTIGKIRTIEGTLGIPGRLKSLHDHAAMFLGESPVIDLETEKEKGSYVQFMHHAIFPKFPPEEWNVTADDGTRFNVVEGLVPVLSVFCERVKGYKDPDVPLSAAARNDLKEYAANVERAKDRHLSDLTEALRRISKKIKEKVESNKELKDAFEKHTLPTPDGKRVTLKRAHEDLKKIIRAHGGCDNERCGC